MLEKKKREQQEKRNASKKRQKKHNIKRPLSAYIRFSVSRRKEIIAREPELRHPKKFKEIAQRISQEWKELSAKRRKEIEQEAAADSAKYKQKVQEWKEKHGPKKRKKNRKGLQSRGSTANAAGTKEKKTQQEDSEGGSDGVEAANAATDVPESSDEISNNSRQSSGPEPLLAGEAGSSQALEKPPATVPGDAARDAIVA